MNYTNNEKREFVGTLIFLVVLVVGGWIFAPYFEKRIATKDCLELEAQMLKFQNQAPWYATRIEHDACHELGVELYPVK